MNRINTISMDAVILVEMLCLSACQPSNTTPPSSGNPISSSAFSSTTSESQETSSENSDALVSENESQYLSEKPLTDDEEFVIIVPDKNLPASEPPQTDGPPKIDVNEDSSSHPYQAGAIWISRIEIDGTIHLAEIAEAEIKNQVLTYVDNMQPSNYTVENVPPGGGQIINVEVHRNNEIERYVFSDQVVDGNALGKDLYNLDEGQWTIVDSEAFGYLSHLLA